MRLERAYVWLIVGKIAALVLVAAMTAIQVPELIYDFGPAAPVRIENRSDLAPGRFAAPTFASVVGSVDVDRMIRRHRHGLTSTYAQLEPYGAALIVRAHDGIDPSGGARRRFVGKLRPLDGRPSAVRIREMFMEQFGVQVSSGGYLLDLNVVPCPSRWQLGALAFSCALWLGLFYLFFLYGRRPRPHESDR